MKQAHNAIHTFLYDERTDFTALSNARCWSLAMITNRCWYQVDWHAQNAPDNSTSTLFADTIPVLTQLQQAGFKLGICSNLAAPYAAPIEQLLPFRMDANVWSFEVGAVKPDPAIYLHVCRQLGLEPEKVLMIGDTLDADVLGPRSVGMRSIQIVRDLARPCDEGLRSLTELLELLQ